MFTTFTIIKFVHILMAIIAVGFNASYGVWLARAGRDPEHEEWAVAGIKILDDRFANPAYGLLLITGLIMVGISYPRITDLWIILALILYTLAIVLGITVYTRVPAAVEPWTEPGHPPGSERRGHRVPDGHQADPLTERWVLRYFCLKPSNGLRQARQ